MKKLLLLCTLPLSLALFSFMSKGNDTGVTYISDNYYDVAAQNSISAQDQAAIFQQIAGIYGIEQIDPNKDYYLNINTGRTTSSTLSTRMTFSYFYEKCTYGDIPVLPNNNIIAVQNIAAVLNSYAIANN